MKLQEKIINFLKQNPGQKYTARSIAQWIVATYPQECRQKLNRSPTLHNEADLVKQLAAEIKPDSLRKKVPAISTRVDRPRKIYYPDDDDSVAPAEHITPTPATGVAVSEQELYSLLCDFLSSELDVISKRIDEICVPCGPRSSREVAPMQTKARACNCFNRPDDPQIKRKTRP